MLTWSSSSNRRNGLDVIYSTKLSFSKWLCTSENYCSLKEEKKPPEAYRAPGGFETRRLYLIHLLYAHLAVLLDILLVHIAVGQRVLGVQPRYTESAISPSGEIPEALG